MKHIIGKCGIIPGLTGNVQEKMIVEDRDENINLFEHQYPFRENEINYQSPVLTALSTTAFNISQDGLLKNYSKLLTATLADHF